MSVLVVKFVGYEAQDNEFAQMIRTVREVSYVQTFRCTATLFIYDISTNACAVCANARLVSKMQAIRNNVKLFPGRRP